MSLHLLCAESYRPMCVSLYLWGREREKKMYLFFFSLLNAWEIRWGVFILWITYAHAGSYHLFRVCSLPIHRLRVHPPGTVTRARFVTHHHYAALVCILVAAHTSHALALLLPPPLPLPLRSFSFSWIIMALVIAFRSRLQM